MFTNLIPTLLKVLDVLPMKGYRNLICLALALVASALDYYKVLPAGAGDVLIPSLLAMTAYYAGAHEK